MLEHVTLSQRTRIFFIAFAILVLLPLPAFGSGRDVMVEAFNERISRNYDRAIELYTKAIETEKLPADSLSKAYWGRGLSYRSKGLYDHAIEDFNTALGIDSADNTTHMFLTDRGITYSEKGLYDRAIQDFNTAISLDADPSFILLNRGIAYFKKGDHNRAIDDFTAARESGFKLPELLVWRATAFNAKGLYDRALHDLDTALTLRPDYPEALNTRGYTYNVKGL
jgi:tetratricopeptide (TPR) repeat protein